MKMKIIFLVALLVIGGHSRHEDRSFLNFYSMISHAVSRSPIAYNGYGNWCGLGPYGNDPEPVDQLDNCCKKHDKCYEATGCKGLHWAVVNLYSWNWNEDNKIICGKSLELDLIQSKWSLTCKLTCCSYHTVLNSIDYLTLLIHFPLNYL